MLEPAAPAPRSPAHWLVHRLARWMLPLSAATAILVPYLTLDLPFRTALETQAGVILAAVVATLGVHLLARRRERIPWALPRPLAVTLGLYMAAAVLGLAAALWRGNEGRLVLGQFLSMALLPLAALAGAALPPTVAARAWRWLAPTVTGAVAVAALFHGGQWLLALGHGTPQLRPYLANGAAVVGPALLALLFAVALHRRYPRAATAAALLIGLYVLVSGVRGLWLVTLPALLLMRWLAGEKVLPGRGHRLAAGVAGLAAGVFLLVCAAAWTWSHQRETNRLGPRWPATQLLEMPVAGLEVVPEPLPEAPERRLIQWRAEAEEREVAVFEPLPVPAPRLWRLVAELRGGPALLRPSLAEPSGAEGWVRAVWLDARGQPLGDLRAAVRSGAGWKEVTAVGMAPRDTAFCRILIGAQAGGPGDVWTLGELRLETPAESRAGVFYQQVRFFRGRLGSALAVLSGEQALSQQSRFRVQESASLLEAFRAAPWGQKVFGAGLGATFVIRPWHPAYDNTGLDPDNLNYVHNFYLFLLYKLGILGTLLVLAALVWWLPWQVRRLRRLPPGTARDLGAAVVAGWVAYCVWAVTSPEILDFRVAPLWGLALALGAFLGQTEEGAAASLRQDLRHDGLALWRRGRETLERLLPDPASRPLVGLVLIVLAAPYLTLPLPHRAALHAQALLVLLATLGVLALGLLRPWRGRSGATPLSAATRAAVTQAAGTQAVTAWHGAPRGLRWTLVLYLGAAVFGAFVGLVHGNGLAQVAGQLLSMVLLPLAAFAGLTWRRPAAWAPLPTVLWGSVAAVAGAHLLHWAVLVAAGQPNLRLYLEDHASAVGLSLLALVLAVAAVTDPPRREPAGVRRKAALVAVVLLALYVLGSGVRGLWLATVPTLLLFAWLSGNLHRLRSRRLLAAAAALAALATAFVWGFDRWLEDARPNLLPSSRAAKLAAAPREGYDLSRSPSPDEPRRRVVVWAQEGGERSFPFSANVLLEPGYYRLRAELRGEGGGQGILAVHWLDSRGKYLGALRARGDGDGAWRWTESLGLAPTGTAAARLVVGTTSDSAGSWELREARLERLSGLYAGTVLHQLRYLMRRLTSVRAPSSAGSPDMYRSVAFRLRESLALVDRFRQASWSRRLLGHGLGATFAVDLTGLDLWDERIDPKSLHYVHNFYAFLLFKLGLVGGMAVLVALGIWLIAPLRRVRTLPRGSRRSRLAAVCALWLGYCLWSVSSPEILNFRMAPLWGLLLAMTAALLDGEEEEWV